MKKARCKRKKINSRNCAEIVWLWLELFFVKKKENSTFLSNLVEAVKKKKKFSNSAKWKKLDSGGNWASPWIVVQGSLLFPPQWIMCAHCDLSGAVSFTSLGYIKSLQLGLEGWGASGRQHPESREHETSGNMSNCLGHWRFHGMSP
jgi:hypothetical protein